MITLKHAAEKVAPGAVPRRHDAVREHRARTDRHAEVSTCAGHPAHRHGARGEDRHRCLHWPTHSPPAEWW